MTLAREWSSSNCPTSKSKIGHHHGPELYSTVGVHPTRCDEFHDDPQTYFQSLVELAQDGKRDGTVVAIGEFGLDYDRVDFCALETQRRYFEKQFELAEITGLPLFLHNRNTSGEFSRLLGQHRESFRKAVVHSFTGNLRELEELLAVGDDDQVYIGVNGCSLKTAENLEVVRAIPLDRLVLETDAPYCELRPTHASFNVLKECCSDGPFRTALPEMVKKPEKFQLGKRVRGRNEPCALIEVLAVVAQVKEIDRETLAAQVYENTVKVFGFEHHPHS